MGILVSVEAHNAAGLLQLLATGLNQTVSDVNLIAAAMGLASAVVDNVSKGRIDAQPTLDWIHVRGAAKECPQSLF
jgi:DNA-binding transcriptional regulator YdaS (Cro superfamily)